MSSESENSDQKRKPIVSKLASFIERRFTNGGDMSGEGESGKTDQTERPIRPKRPIRPILTHQEHHRLKEGFYWEMFWSDGGAWKRKREAERREAERREAERREAEGVRLEEDKE